MQRRTFIARVLGAATALAIAPRLTIEEEYASASTRYETVIIESEEGNQFVFDRVPIRLIASGDRIGVFFHGKCSIDAQESFTVSRIYAEMSVIPNTVSKVDFPFQKPLYIHQGNTLTLLPMGV